MSSSMLRPFPAGLAACQMATSRVEHPGPGRPLADQPLEVQGARSMGKSSCVGLTAALWLACAPPGEQAPDIRQQALVGGTVDTGDPAMMEMFGVAGTRVVR